ncbi:MAG: glycosyltransferase, partial [Candidatus Aenigmatarchaeota archaeon]
MELAPVVLFIYNRVDTLSITLESLSNNTLAQDTTLYIYADGPKENATSSDIEKITAARKFAKSKKWCKEVYFLEKEHNLGLANSIISGVTEIVNKYGKVIVLEDDLELSPYFLNYMNDALNVYEHEPKVWSIGACNFFSTKKHTPETFFLPIISSWGWATWSDRWKYFDYNAEKLLKEIQEKKLEDKFNLNGAFDYIQLLQDQIQGRVSSWAICWYAQVFLHNAFTLFPKFSLVVHQLSQEATHAKDFSPPVKFPSKPIKVIKQEVICL